MYKTILVHVTGAETDRPALATASSIARADAGHINCMKVRMDTGAMIAMASGAAMAPAAAVAETFQLLEDQDVQMTARARQAFDTICREDGLLICDTPRTREASATWVEQSGDELEEITAAGRLHDLVIASRKSENHNGFSPNDLGALIVGCGRPVLIASRKSPETLGRKVAIAWKDTPEAARAICAAMPLIERAQHVVLLSVAEDNDHAAACVECAEQIAESLRWHCGCVEVRHPLPGGLIVPDTILEAACDAGADILVAGAYGHSRLREMVFGGFTQRVLERADIPVLLFH